jgi:hypothetical protein
MKDTTKLLALAGILPVMADFIEDLVDNKTFTKTLKMKANYLYEEIRKIDNKITNHSDQEIHSQQVYIGIEFIKWLKDLEAKSI